MSRGGEQRRPLGAALIGTGRGGGEIVRACAARGDVRLVAGVTTSAAKEGADLGETTIGTHAGVPLTRDLDAVLARSDVDVVLHAGLGEAREVAELLGRCADAGKDAITIAGLVHPPTALGADGAAALDARARAGGARIVGTGVNPGFLLDVLPVTWASLIARVDRLRAVRVADIRHWGDGVLEHEIGVGRPPAEVEGSPALSLAESLALIADGLGLALDRREDLHETLPALTPREHGGRRVAVGETVGFLRRARGWRGGELVVEIEWRAVFCLDPAVDGAQESARLAIDGDTCLEAGAAGTFLSDPYPGTAARALSAVAPLASLPPGLYRPDQLPTSRRRT